MENNILGNDSPTAEEVLENIDLLVTIQGVEMIEKGGCLKAMEEYAKQRDNREVEELKKQLQEAKELLRRTPAELNTYEWNSANYLLEDINLFLNS